MIKCPTCNHDLLFEHRTIETEDSDMLHWGCIVCRECIIWNDDDTDLGDKADQEESYILSLYGDKGDVDKAAGVFIRQPELKPNSNLSTNGRPNIL